jgi:hypothetical protein
VREVVASKILYFCKIDGKQNPGDVLTKYLPYAVCWPHVQPFLSWEGQIDKTIVDPDKESKKNPVKESKKNPDNKEPKSDSSRGVTTLVIKGTRSGTWIGLNPTPVILSRRGRITRFGRIA